MGPDRRRASAASSLALVGILGVGMMAPGCPDRTSILIVVTSDLAVPDEVDRLDFAVRGDASGMVIERSFPLSAPWPHSLAVRPGMVDSRSVRVTITAYRGDEFVLRRVISADFAAGFESVLEVNLERACVRVRCEQDLDCRAGNCIGARPDAGPLPPDANIDASIDVGFDTNQDAPCFDPSLVNCGMVCIDPRTDNNFCGAQPGCVDYDRCQGSEFCFEGRCRLDCDPGLVNCNGFCIDPESDRTNCGASLEDCSGGTVCPGMQVCALGRCSDTCPAGLFLCDGRCVDPQTDRRYCGARPDCSGGTACLAGEQCAQGECVTTCPADQIACGGRCIDPLSDRTYCGARPDCSGGTPCPPGQLCVAGTCGTSCPLPQIACGGRCVDVNEDESYCGARPDCTGGRACRSGEICRGGVCITNCPEGQVGCDGRCIDPMTDEQYCGASITCTGAVACAPREFCTGGRCGCVSPERNCGSGCVDTRFDPLNCGDCGNACPTGQVCSGGSCTPLSGGGFTGEFGASWTVHPFRNVACIQEFVPRTSNDLYAGIGPTFGAYDLATMTFRDDLPPPPVSIPADCSFAFYAGGIFMLTPTDIIAYAPAPVMTWRSGMLPMPLDTVGMTISDGSYLWTAATTAIVRGSPATTEIEEIRAGTTMMRPRITYDALTGRIFFAGQGQREIRSYDPLTRTVRSEGMAPGNIGAPFCSDRAGHIYVGSQAMPRQLWQYTPASGRWRDLPMIPGSAPAVTNCGIAEAGALYVAADGGAEIYRLSLTRL